VSSNLDDSTNWKWEHDPGTPGSSVGTTAIVSSPSRDGAARKFSMTYSSNGGERYHLSFANDTSATHFVYDTWVYVANPAKIQNLELDMNQVMANGKTVVYGLQCSNVSKTWEYTTIGSSGSSWHASNLYCDPKTWTANTWYHVQLASHRDSNGIVTYDWVNLNGKQSNFNGASGNSAAALGWATGILLVNFQIDGSGSDSITIYADSFKVYRW
jgi:hypothetical protein